MIITHKSLILSLAMLLSGALATAAQDVSGYPLGHCDGELSTSSRVKHDTAGDWISSGVFIAPETAATVAGNHIDKMNVGLCSTIHIEKVTVWIRSDLNGSNLAETTVDVSDLKKGWNLIDLEKPYNIPADGKGFYLGYSILQDGRCAGPAVLTKPGVGSFYYQAGNADWQDMSSQYTLCLEGMAYGDNLPKYNVTLEEITPQSVFIVSDGNLKCVASVRNRGTVIVTGLDFSVDIDGAEQPVSGHADCSIPFGETQNVVFTVRPVLKSVPESCGINVTVTSVNGNNDEDPTDNTAVSSFDVMADAFPRTVIVEEFTTENCPNCPAAATKLHNVLAEPFYSDNVVAVCHHSGYRYDSFTTAFDRDYEWFYNANGGTYAPAMMLDRALTVESNTPVFFPSSESMLKNEIDKRLASPSSVSLAISAEKKSDSKLTVSVFGKRIDGMDDDLNVTVFLVENNISTDQQAGVGAGYLHQHVSRAVNQTWGSPVVWSGNEYEGEFTFPLDGSWNYDNLEVVAMMNRYNETDPKGCSVENAAHIYLSNSGLNEIAEDKSPLITGYYDLMGRRFSEPLSDGIFIVTYSDGSYRKIIIR